MTSIKESGKDFSLKEGEKISINIPGMAKKTEKPSAPLLGGSGGLKKLAPPPGSKKLAPPGGMMSAGAPASFNSGVPQ